jgi:putative ABC transport system substrate-binding protein
MRELARDAGGYVSKILSGAKAADLPVEQPRIFELVVNMNAARQIGVTVPKSLKRRADTLIQ